MLYYLERLSEGATSDFLKAFNVFQYITFRSVFAALTAFVLSLLFGNYTIRKLLSLKFGQPIRTADEVNKLADLHGKKAGTPTMGGILLLGSTVISTLLWAKSDNTFVWLVLASMLAAGGLGFADDYLKVSKRNSAGVRERTKLIVQLFIAIGVTWFFLSDPQLQIQAQALYVPFYKKMIVANMGPYITFLFISGIIMGTSNAVNLTDGLDGLAIGCVLITTLIFGGVAYLAGHAVFAHYLNISPVAGAGELAVFCAALVGGGVVFLWHNAAPAEIYMGDVGALGIGGALGAVACLMHQPFLLAIVGGVFVLEALSVLLQVGYFKYTGGRRLFLMTPIHHHFQKMGWASTKVVARFWILSFLFGLLGLLSLKLR